MILTWEQRKHLRTPMGLRYRFGGDSASTQATENNDMRVVGGDNSINLSQKVSGSNNVVTTTDHGAVKGGIDLAMKGIELAHSTDQAVIDSSQSLLQGALRMAGDQQQQFTKTIENLKGNDVRVLVVAGLGVVAIAAVFAFKKG